MQKLVRLTNEDNVFFTFQPEETLFLFGRVIVPKDATFSDDTISQNHRSELSIHTV